MIKSNFDIINPVRGGQKKGSQEIMIDKDNFKELLLKLGFIENGTLLYKEFAEFEASLKVDFSEEKLIYPTDKGFTISGDFTTTFKQKENFVVFECVHRLFKKGYRPEHITLEPKWNVGHGASGGRADIMVKDNTGKSLLIIECKTAGKEYEDEWKKTLINGGQIISYAKQAGSTQFVCLYTSDFIDNEVKYFNYIITLKDNENLLRELADKKPLSYQEAKLLDKEDIFRAWKETYSQGFATKGIFEDDIRAYEIGKTKYSIKDLNPINSKDIQGKYHEFATILRQHNVSGRENAFDKLVNLFLCKIVDETNNPEELKFYWKGIAYDDFFRLQDRLQQLYQEGMKRFLGEEVTYIDNKAIDNAFRFFENDPDATRDTIKGYFRELKFFTNNDFAFIDVHNEKLFYQNSIVLLKIVQMLQDIQLKTEEQNQFLGDMFEGFLDQGVKQSEGQFFTPMPIVKFILKSLPLEQIITESEQIPKVIDYACGAGHFLNEYAQQIKPIVEQHKDIEVDKYYQEIVGIEKEYRLSKVAKVSAFMYGQDDINIIYADALSTTPTIKDKEYSVLIANPPYSVKGFLETLTESDRKKYELIETVGEKSYPNNNSIETFFIERAKQLLKPDGVAGIIVPSSILTKGKAKSTSKSKNVYVASREILLKYFDIVGIAEFGGGTFGKTGTNTVTLFIRRKKENPTPAEHYLNRVNAWFKGGRTKNDNDVYKDEGFIRKYCNHLEISFEDYKTLLEGSPNEKLLETDIFREYRKEFEKWSEIKNRKKQKTFKNLNKEQQNAELEKRFLGYVQETEKDKLYYFVLASLNPQKVIIVKSPSKTAEIKEFLGYEWSSAKGNEGIKYLGGVTLNEVETEDEDEGNVTLEEEEKRVLSNIFNLDNINTPLYDPKKPDNNKKINYLISQNFKGESFEIPAELENYVMTARLVDMLDFSRPDFNKSINLTPKKSVEIETKWDLVRLGDVFEVIAGQSPKSEHYNEVGNGLPFYQGKKDFGVINLQEPKVWTSQVTKESIKGDILISVRAPVGDVNFNPFEKICIGRGLAAIRNENDLAKKFLFEYIVSHQFIFKGYHGATFDAISTDDLRAIKIPFPPSKVQKQIVEACKVIDREFEEAEKTIIEQKEAIDKLIVDLESYGHPKKKISDLAIVNPSKTEVQHIDGNTIVSFVEMASVSEEGYISHREDRLLKDVKRGSYRYFAEGDIIIAKITPCMENGKCAIATNLTNEIGFGSSEFHVFRVNEELSSNKFVFAFLNREKIRKEAEKNMTGSSGHRRVPDTFYKNLQIPVPTDKREQENLIAEIEKCERTIRKAEDLIKGTAKRKEEVIKQYL